MPDLPDLDTGNISYVAYWNALDSGGVSDIDPTDVTSDGGINSYSLYDNGVHIDSYTTAVGRNCGARVKEDGWIVAWFDRDETYGLQLDSPPAGWWDIGNNWRVNDNGASDYNRHTLERVVASLQNNLSNSANITYNTADVGLYNYEYPAATGTTGMSIQGKAINGTQTGGLSYTASTTVYAAVAVGGTYSTAESKFAGVSLAHTNDYPHREYGARDLVENGDIPTSGTEYTAEISSPSNNSNQRAKADVLVVWG